MQSGQRVGISLGGGAKIRLPRLLPAAAAADTASTAVQQQQEAAPSIFPPFQSERSFSDADLLALFLSLLTNFEGPPTVKKPEL